MVKDLYLIKDITPLFEKKVIVWGIGNRGRYLIKKMMSMGAGKEGILLCDANRTLWGDEFLSHKIMSPAQMQECAKRMGIHNIIILVTVLSIKIQNEIIKNIEELLGEDVEIYTEYAVECGLYFGLKNPCVNSEFRKSELLERDIANRYLNEKSVQVEKVYKYFTFLPLHNDEIILVYQPGKVASSSIYKSIQNYGHNVLHCHILADIRDNEDDLHKILNMKSGKIICLVRDPVARRLSEMWQNMMTRTRYAIDADFNEVEKYYFDCAFENIEFRWFENEMKKTFNLDVFDHWFDKDKGYSIIKQENIELLLMKMEKLDKLENVIGSFLGIENFQLQNDNMGEGKSYRFAMEEYKKYFSISQERLEEIYKKNDYMRHFYSDQECNEFYDKWMWQNKGLEN